MNVDTYDMPTPRRPLFKFDPTVNTGTLLQITIMLAGAVAAYGAYQADKERTAMQVAQIKLDLEVNRSDVKGSLGDLRVDMKEMQRTLSEVRQTLAIINARAPSKGAP